MPCHVSVFRALLLIVEKIPKELLKTRAIVSSLLNAAPEIEGLAESEFSHLR